MLFSLRYYTTTSRASSYVILKHIEEYDLDPLGTKIIPLPSRQR